MFICLLFILSFAFNGVIGLATEWYHLFASEYNLLHDKGFLYVNCP